MRGGRRTSEARIYMYSVNDVGAREDQTEKKEREREKRIPREL